MLAINQARPAFDAAAPFGGWKRSGHGPPEHGRWDREFYARPQAIYD
jgi:aldehyde dehydrogenase (NAD+)